VPPTREGRARLLIRTYLEERAPVWTEDTRANEGKALADFLGFIATRERASADACELTQAHVLAFVFDVRSRVTKRKGTPWTAASIISTLGPVYRFLRWCFRLGHILQDLAALITLPRPDRLPRALSEADVTALLDHGPRPGPMNARDAAVLETLYGTGLRGSELARLQTTDVDLYQRLLIVRQGKGRKDRIMPFGERVRAAILRYLRECRDDRPGVLFQGVRGGKLDRCGVNAIVTAAARRAGVVASSHRLRHSYATHLLRHGAALPEIQALMGHASLQSTEIYLRVEVGDLDRMLERSHPRERSRERPREAGRDRPHEHRLKGHDKD
jgi:integrase/recombinase XerD